jgi:uncharacterized coiled-coil protein SlyX
MEQELSNNKRDIDKFANELLELTNEFKSHKEQQIKENFDNASML